MEQTRKARPAAAAAASLTKSEMHALLMDYFLLEGYQDAVLEFSNESLSSPAPSADQTTALLTLEARNCIRSQISNGNILGSLQVIEREFPEILLDPSLLFKLYHQHFVECLVSGKLQEALEFASERITPLAMQSRSLLEEMEQMMCLVLFAHPAALADQVPLQYHSKLSLEQRHSLAAEVNSTILSSQGQRSEPRVVTALKEMVCHQKALKRKAHLTFPQPEIEL
jgi:glucose-induced degradation protein 8